MYGDKDRIKAHGFFATFRHYPVQDEWMQELYNYFICGFHPGSFHRACFANNLFRASIHTHVGNKWLDIVALMKWVNEFAIDDSWGSYENVNAWLALTNKAREKILLKRGYIITDEEVTFKILETQ